MSESTENNECQGYQPTPAENKLLEVLLNPKHRFLSKTEITEIAGIDRTSYYVAFKKPEFVEFYKNKAKDLIDQAVVPVIHTFQKQAIAGSYQHGKALLDMASMSNDSLRIDSRSINFDTTDPKEAERLYSEMIKGK